MRLFAFIGGLAIAAVLVAAALPSSLHLAAPAAAVSAAPAFHAAAELAGLAAASIAIALCLIVIAAVIGATTSISWLGRLLLRLVDARRESAGWTTPLRPPRLLC